MAPGLIFAEDDDVAPDIVWSSSARLAQILGPDGKLHAAPELIVEVASSSRKIDLGPKFEDYRRAGVREYVVVTIDPDPANRPTAGGLSRANGKGLIHAFS